MKLSPEKRRQLRMRRSRARVSGTPQKPRLSVCRSNAHMSCQLIDDLHGLTLAAASSKEVVDKKGETKVEVARLIGVLVADRAKKAGISQAVFHKGSYKYHGRVKAVAEGAREGGLAF